MNIFARNILAALSSCFLIAGVALAQEAAGGSPPPETVPANAKAEVEPFGFVIEPLRFVTEPTIGDVSVKKEGRETRFTLAADVLFNFDKAELRPEADVALGKFVAELGSEAARARLRIEGHTDGKGTDAYNDRLAQQRAQSVQDWLMSSGGLSQAAMSTASFGKRKPVAANTKPDGSDDRDGRQKNRRVEIIVAPL